MDQVTIWPQEQHVRVELVWRAGEVQELLIYRPRREKHRAWTEAERAILQEHYAVAPQDELMALLPGRTWEAIRKMATRLKLSRENVAIPQGDEFAYTAEEDELVRRYYAGEITREEATSTGRSTASLKKRAKRLGIEWQPRRATWEWVDKGSPTTQGDSSPRLAALFGPSPGARGTHR